MKAFYWMMVKTTSIPETGSGGYFLPDNQAISSISRQFHVLVVIVAIYHIVTSKRYSNNLLLIYSLRLK